MFDAKGMMIFPSEVISVQDDNAGMRIKVRLEPYDNNKALEDIPYCFPLLPKHIHCNPKVGECVLVFLSTMGATDGQRWFIGPIISQQYNLDYDPYKYRSRVLLSGDYNGQPYPNPKVNPDNNGSCPEREDIALQGRGNSDVILKKHDALVRCGFKMDGAGNQRDRLRFNREDLSYMLMRYKDSVDSKGKPYSSSINLVADRINLLSHDSSDVFNLSDPDDLITDDTMQEILASAHQLPYGDKLVEFLRKFIEVFRTHVHPFPKLPPSLTEPQQNVLATDLQSMLSESIRIN